MSRPHSISGCENQNRKADVVFVHGLGGDAFATWRHGKEDSGFWPRWLGEQFPDVGVWSVGYAASASKWTRLLGWLSKRWRDNGHGMPLTRRAQEVLNQMTLRGLGERPLVFITHSLGGLVTKQILRTSSDAIEGRRERGVFHHTRAVLFLATPHTGADLASLLSGFRAVVGATVTLQELQAHDAHLENLYNWYRNHSGEKIQTACYYEQRPVKGFTIVNPTSAHPGVGEDPVPLDEDHISICKPTDRDAAVYLKACQLLRAALLPREPAPAPVKAPTDLANYHAPVAPVQVIIQHPAAQGSHEARVPHELPPLAAEFFGRSAELARLITRLKERKNTAVAGPGGLGKTALAAQALREVVGDSHQALAGSPYPDGVVYLDLYIMQANAEAAWNKLADKLAGADFEKESTGKARATSACQGRNFLLVIEGGEEADGREGRPDLSTLLSVLSLENRRLILTRLKTQAASAETIELDEQLGPKEAGLLFDSIAGNRIDAKVREEVLGLLEGQSFGADLGLQPACPGR